MKDKIIFKMKISETFCVKRFIKSVYNLSVIYFG